MRKPEYASKYHRGDIVDGRHPMDVTVFVDARDYARLEVYAAHLEQRESREGKLREAAVLNLCREFLEAVDDEYEEEQPGRNQNGFMDAVGFARSKVYAEKAALADDGTKVSPMLPYGLQRAAGKDAK